jgi:hypothetical protein
MVDDKKVKRIVEYFSRNREGGKKQLATINERAEDAVARTSHVTKLKKLVKESPQKKTNNVDFELSESATISIYKKAYENNIDPNVLFEVYSRGINSWHDSLKATPQQLGFARINSYVMKGKTYYNEDSDLHENFQDGRNPQDKGDMARHGLKGKSISQLKKVRSSSKASPRQKQLAHWFINMHKDK